MANLTVEEKEFLDDKFEQFKLDFWKRFKIPAIGLAVVFAGLMSIFATYLYMQAKVNVMESQAELAQAKATFYSGMQKANEEMEGMITSYNDMVEQAGLSVEMMKIYEKELEHIATKHKNILEVDPKEESMVTPPAATTMPPAATTIMPPGNNSVMRLETPQQLAPMVEQRDVFKIPEQYKKQ